MRGVTPVALALAVAGGVIALAVPLSPSPAPAPADGSCFLLYEEGIGQIRRAPSDACGTRVTPESTFKIAHGLEALDAELIAGADDTFKYDGSPQPYPDWRRDHTLTSAMRYSVVWYFQKIASLLGPEREQAYARRLNYGNMDTTSHLTSFWLGESLLISPDEQARFLLRLYRGELPISPHAQDVVQRVLIQPSGQVFNATGAHPFSAPWPSGTVLAAKTGSGPDRSGRDVRWIAGHVSRAGHNWVFVSCVIGPASTPALAAIDLAARALHEEHVL
jgi:beta-lactamase class D